MSKHIPTTGSGKGSAPRKNDDNKAYGDNWEKIFGNADQKQKQAQVTDLNWDGAPDDNNVNEQEIDKS